MSKTMEVPKAVDAIDSFSSHGQRTADDCQKLARTLPASKVPSECDKYLTKAAQQSGLTGGPVSGINVWNPSTGHGKRSFFFGRDGLDTVKTQTQNATDTTKGKSSNSNLNAEKLNGAQGQGVESVDKHFLTGKDPEVQEKIRRLRTRMSVRGALNVPGIDDKEVEAQRQKELLRRQTRKQELKGTVKHHASHGHNQQQQQPQAA